METNTELIEVLNDLIQINNDRIEGYEKAIENIDSAPVYKITFEKMISQSAGYRDELIAEVRKTGGDPDWNSTTASGKIYRAWMDVKSAFTGHSDKSALELCEFGEDAAQKAYETALKETVEMPGETRSLIVSQQAGLKQSHDLIKAARDMEKAKAKV
jgi:uncharacterized protein (TIGR02284 family)